MALRDSPYFPFYVQDFLTDEKLAECSAESTGVYIRLLCIMHKSEEYGCICLKAKDKKLPDPVANFALKLTRQMPYIEDVIERSLAELIEEGVLKIDGDRLFQKRMVRDGQASENRAEAGRKGGSASKSQANHQAKAKQNLKQNASKTSSKTQANSENEIEIEYENDNEEYESIINYYNLICKTLPAVRQITKTRRANICSRQEMLKKAGMTWEQYFRSVDASDFLSGRNGIWQGCSFDWLIKPANMLKVIEGNYANRVSAEEEAEQKRKAEMDAWIRGEID